MADTRILHKRGSHGERIVALTDFEYRVWVQYILSADDFGVMRASISVLQADNPRLEKATAKSLWSALSVLRESGLVDYFTHQGIEFLWQPDWQDFQGIRYPRESVLPLPPDDIIGLATDKTEKLFRIRSEMVRSDFRNLPEKFPTPARARKRETLTQTQTLALRTRSKKELDLDASGFAAFWADYPKKASKQDAIAAWKKLSPDDATQAAIVSGLTWQAKQPKWHEKGGKYIPHAATWLNGRRWEDEPFNPPDTTDAAFDRVFAAMGVRDDGQ